MTSRILLTGFSAPVFLNPNPSELLMKVVAQSQGKFPRATVRTLVLNVDFSKSKAQFREAVREFKPDAVLSFGVDCDRDFLCVERVGINLDCDDTPDNAGVVRNGVKIVEGGPVGYWATVPVEDIVASFRGKEIGAVASGYAGGHLCNHILYYGLHLVAEGDHKYRMGFFYVPPLPDPLQEGWQAKRGMSIEILLEATRIINSVVVESLLTGSVRRLG